MLFQPKSRLIGALSTSSDEAGLVPETDEDSVPPTPRRVSPSPQLAIQSPPPTPRIAPAPVPLLPFPAPVQQRPRLAPKSPAPESKKTKVVRKPGRPLPPPMESTDDEEIVPPPKRGRKGRVSHSDESRELIEEEEEVGALPKRRKQKGVVEVEEMRFSDGAEDVGTSRLQRRMQRVKQGGRFLSEDEESLERESEDEH